MSLSITVLVEGSVDATVALKICKNEKIPVLAVYGQRGKSHIDEKLKSINDNIVNGFPWFVLRDMDHDADCAPELISRLLPNASHLMCFRIVVREIEAWLMADRDNFSRFFGVSVNQIPGDPDLLEDPKNFVINLAKKSKKKTIKEDMVPRVGSGAEGPAYNSTLSEFVRDHWRPEVGAERSDSLSKCLKRLNELKGKGRT